MRSRKQRITLCLMATTALCLAGQSFAQDDFFYHVNPPRILMNRTEVIPQTIPFCSGGSVICYSPQFIRAAYDFPSNLDGRGQTILLVEAFGSPTIRHDLAVFDQFFGIPDPPTFTILCPKGGCPAFNPHDPQDQISWAFETNLDVEYAHAMAPAASIVLVVGETSSGNAMNAAMARAIKEYPGSIMSLSFGTPEIVARGNRFQFLQAHRNFEDAMSAGITVVAATGDFGATNGFATANATFPASDPLVLSVGGTEGNPSPGGLAGCTVSTCPDAYGGEQVWNEFNFATGGSPSLFFTVPAYQSGLGLKMRTTPDVAYNAALNGGVLVANSFLTGTDTFFLMGGTSAGAPQWAGILALANQAAGRPLGFMNAALYQVAKSGAYAADFHDITVGNNRDQGTPIGFNAIPGYDFATGWGTPDVARLIPDLISASTH